MKKQSLLVLFALTVFLSSCLGPAKINKWVDKHCGETLNAATKTKTEYVSVTSPLATADLKASTTKKQVKHFLPLLFFWQYDYMNTCTLNPKIPVNMFRSAVQSYANNKGLRQKLNGQKIELSVDKLPNVFLLNDRGHIVYALIYAFGWDDITFRPDNQELVVSYKVMNGDMETQKGIITVPNGDKVRQLRLFQGIRKATYQYLDQYNENIKAMSKVAVDKIIANVTTQNQVVAK
jgi:hypothetical protein